MAYEVFLLPVLFIDMSTDFKLQKSNIVLAVVITWIRDLKFRK